MEQLYRLVFRLENGDAGVDFFEVRIDCGLRFVELLADGFSEFGDGADALQFGGFDGLCAAVQSAVVAQFVGSQRESANGHNLVIAVIGDDAQSAEQSVCAPNREADVREQLQFLLVGWADRRNVKVVNFLQIIV